MAAVESGANSTVKGSPPGGAENLDTAGMQETLDKQIATQKELLVFSTRSNLANAEHSNKKSMTDKIGNS